MNKRYKFFKWLRDLSSKQMRENYLKPRGGCDSCCTNCFSWESEGNKIITTPLDDGSDKRVCTKCNHEWIAIFTPAGFIPVKDCDIK